MLLHVSTYSITNAVSCCAHCIIKSARKNTILFDFQTSVCYFVWRICHPDKSLNFHIPLASSLAHCSWKSFGMSVANWTCNMPFNAYKTLTDALQMYVCLCVYIYVYVCVRVNMCIGAQSMPIAKKAELWTEGRKILSHRST